jgi:hypothetical protein
VIAHGSGRDDERLSNLRSRSGEHGSCTFTVTMNARLSLLLAGAALTMTPAVMAQQESAATVMNEPTEPPAAGNTVVVEGGPNAPSPHWTQTRSFAATRFWLLDPWRQSVEAWYTVAAHHDGEDVTKHLWQIEYMVSPFRGFQLDVYFNYVKETGDDAHVEGAQIEGRFAPWRYGEVFLNPTLYLEWHPQTRGPNRGEVRLLLGGEITRRLRGAINPFIEQNLDSRDGVRDHFIADREIGVSAAASYAVIDRHLALGGETRLVKDQQGGTTYQNVAKVGPAIWVSNEDGTLFLTSSVLFGLTDKSDKVNAIVVVGVIR